MGTRGSMIDCRRSRWEISEINVLLDRFVHQPRLNGETVEAYSDRDTLSRIVVSQSIAIRM